MAKQRDFFVYSTASNDTAYVVHAEGRPGDPKVVTKRIVIKGKANVADRRTLITPVGVMTRVSAEDMEFLQTRKSFLRHVAEGYIKFTQSKEDAEDVAKDMVKKDKAAPKVKSDFKLKEGEEITVGSAVPKKK